MIIAASFSIAAHGQGPGSGKGSGAPTLDGTGADEIALPAPRAGLGPAHDVAIPEPLGPGDVALMRRILALQAGGNVLEAVRASAGLQDRLLMGTLLADRYLGHHHYSTAAELTDWLANYANQPDAPAVHRLLLARLPKGTAQPPAPVVPVQIRSAEAEPVSQPADPGRANVAQAADRGRSGIDQIRRGGTACALRLIAIARPTAPACVAWLRAEVAQMLFIRNQDADALRVAEASIGGTDPGQQNSLTYYVGGLAAWRLNRMEQARQLFEGAARAAISTPRLRAASAFWASRASRRMNDAVSFLKWLRAAAQERMTFHGILARRILRMDVGIIPDAKFLSGADVDAVGSTPQGLRAYALLQIGQADRAAAELRALCPRAQASPVFGRSLLMVASAAGLGEFAEQLAGLLQAGEGPRFEELHAPVPPLRPSGGFRVDPALVYALTQTESHFDPGATSPGGAQGLMQIMPATAQYVAADLRAADPGAVEERLHDPAINLKIGQRYVAYLSRLDGIGNNLIRLLASYNAGPGSFLRWSGDIRDANDPLLFIEAIPVGETRGFVPDVLAASWIYAAKLHRPAPTLDSLASGQFPRFAPLTQERSETSVVLR